MKLKFGAKFVAVVSMTIVIVVVVVLSLLSKVSKFGAVSDQAGYTLASGIYFSNNLIKSMSNTTRSACKTACDTNSACVGFVMNEGTKECYLKSKKEDLNFASKYTWYDKITLANSPWTYESDGAKSLPQVLTDNKLTSYVASPDLKQMILSKISQVSDLFKDSLKYMTDTNAAKLTNVTYEMAKRMIAARIIMFGIADVAQIDGTRESRASIVPPKDSSGITRLQFNGKLYGFTIDQLMPRSLKSTGITGAFPAETVDDAINYELYRCKFDGKNCGVVEPLRCDTVNTPLVGNSTEVSQCDTTTIYSMYASLEKEFNTYMTRLKAASSNTAASMTSSWCSTTDGVLWANEVGNEVMMCPLTHMNYSTKWNACIKNGVSDSTSFGTGFGATPNTALFTEDAMRAPCAKYYKAFVQGGQFYAPDRAGKDAAAWNPIGTVSSEISGRLTYPNATSMTVWGRGA